MGLHPHTVWGRCMRSPPHYDLCIRYSRAHGRFSLCVARRVCLTTVINPCVVNRYAVGDVFFAELAVLRYICTNAAELFRVSEGETYPPPTPPQTLMAHTLSDADGLRRRALDWRMWNLVNCVMHMVIHTQFTGVNTYSQCISNISLFGPILVFSAQY